MALWEHGANWTSIWGESDIHIYSPDISRLFVRENPAVRWPLLSRQFCLSLPRQLDLFCSLGIQESGPCAAPLPLSRAYSFFDMTRACSYWTGYPCSTQTSLSCGLRPGHQQVNINGNSMGWFEGKSMGNNKSPVDFLAGKNPIRNNREHELFLRWNHVKLGGWT